MQPSRRRFPEVFELARHPIASGKPSPKAALSLTIHTEGRKTFHCEHRHIPLFCIALPCLLSRFLDAYSRARR